MLKYYKLYDLLQRRNMKVKDLAKLIEASDATMAKIRKGKNINTDIIDRICTALEVQPCDIMEHCKDE